MHEITGGYVEICADLLRQKDYYDMINMISFFDEREWKKEYKQERED